MNESNPIEKGVRGLIAIVILPLAMTLSACGGSGTDRSEASLGKQEKSASEPVHDSAQAQELADAESDAVPLMLQDAAQQADFNMDVILEAALSGNAAVIEAALKQGYRVDATDPELHTAMMMSAYNGHADVVKLLLDNGAEVDFRDGMNRTALMYASTGPFNETVTLLLEAGADPNLVDSEEHFSALMFAAAEGQAEVVKTLLKHGADPTLKDVDGESAYDFAMNNGHTEVAEMMK